VSKLAQRMHYYPLENVLNYKNTHEEFDEILLGRVLKQLSPERLLVALSSAHEVKDAKIEKYLKAPYKL
jgi:secreted Zn-dependent insulinase-like peptidase